MTAYKPAAELSEELLEKFRATRLLALDVDGVMSNGALLFTAQGDELKAFNILDGHGIKLLMKNGVEVAIITGRTSPMVARRARDLGIEHLLQGREDKRKALSELTDELSIPLQHTAYMGDDLPDLGAIVAAGLGLSVPNGHTFVKQHADYVSVTAGGDGAVREVCDLLLDAKNLLDTIHSGYLG